MLNIVTALTNGQNVQEVSRIMGWLRDNLESSSKGKTDRKYACYLVGTARF